MALGSIVVRLTMDTATFDTDAGRAAKIADKRAKEIDAAFKKAGTAIGLALSAAALTLASTIKSSINSMDEMSKAAQKVGVSTEEFSKLTYAASLADVSMETLVGSLGKLTKSQAAALKGTSEQSKVFEALGISIKGADGKLRDSTEVLADFADRFKALKGSPEAMAAGFSLFGRSFQELIPLLKDGGQGIRDAGAELESFGGVLSTEAGKNAEEFNDNLTRLETAARSLAQAVASDLLPDLVSLSAQFVGTATDGDKLKETASKLADGIRVIATAAAFVGKAFQAVGLGIATFIGQADAALTFLSGDFAKGIRDYKEATRIFDPVFGGDESSAPDSRKGNGRASRGGRRGQSVTIRDTSQADVDAYTRQLQDALAGGTTTKPKGAKGGESDAERAAEQLESSYARLKDNLNETYELFGKNTEAAKILYDTQNGELAKLDDARKKELVTLAERNDAQRLADELDKAATQRMKEETAAFEASQKAYDDLISNMQFELELIGKTNKEREKAIALRGLDSNATQEQRDQVSGLVDELYRAEEMQGFLDDFKTGLSDAFVDFASGAKSAKEAFGDFADQLFKRALQFVADKAIQAMFDAFSGGGKGGDSGGSGGGWGGFFSSLMGAFGGGKAGGGTASANTMYEVNERGFEMATVGGRDYMLTGSQPVQITPNHKLGGGGVVQNNKFIFAAPTSQRTQDQVAQRNAFELSQAQRRNG